LRQQEALRVPATVTATFEIRRTSAVDILAAKVLKLTAHCISAEDFCLALLHVLHQQ